MSVTWTTVFEAAIERLVTIEHILICGCVVQDSGPDAP